MRLQLAPPLASPPWDMQLVRWGGGAWHHLNSTAHARPCLHITRSRFVAELEMRLQLAAEELSTSLTASSGAALRRVPYAQQEAARLRGDVRTLQVLSLITL